MGIKRDSTEQDEDLALLDDATDGETTENATGDTPADAGANDAEGDAAASGAAGEEGAEEEGDHDDDVEGEVTVSLGDDDQDQVDGDQDAGRAPHWVKQVRKSNRFLREQVRELQAQLNVQAQKATAPTIAAAQIAPKPTLAECDFDEEQFATKLETWQHRKMQAEREAEEQRKAEQAARDAWQAKLDAYTAAKDKLRVPDFEVAEDVVRRGMSITQQGILLSGCARPEAMIYALGKAPARVAELAAITDPVKFTFAVAKLESQLRVTPRKPSPPPPERQIRSSVSGAAAIDNALEKLREDAARTGDYSKVVAYKNQQRAAQRA